VCPKRILIRQRGEFLIKWREAVTRRKEATSPTISSGRPSASEEKVWSSSPKKRGTAIKRSDHQEKGDYQKGGNSSLSRSANPLRGSDHRQRMYDEGGRLGRILRGRFSGGRGGGSSTRETPVAGSG